MKEVTFSKLPKGIQIYTLTRDRRSGYPIYDLATVNKIGDPKPILKSNSSNEFETMVELQVIDSVSSLDIILPADKSEGIYNGIYYTTDINNIINELQLQRNQAQKILDNQENYKAIIKECDSILETLSQSAPEKPKDINDVLGLILKKLETQDSDIQEIFKAVGIQRENHVPLNQ